MTIPSKRSKNLAVVSLVLTVLFFVITLLAGLWSGFFAVFATSWFILVACIVWFTLALQFHQRSLAEQERLDARRSAAEDRPTIFPAGQEQEMAVAQQRLETFEKWFLPIFSAVVAAYQITMGFYLSRAATAWEQVETKEPLLCAVFMTAIAFISFLISRYATGMSGQEQWRPLRAGGSYMLAVAVLCFALAVSLAVAYFKLYVALNFLNRLVPVLLIVLGVETGLNMVLDIYRPRLKGQYHRAAFDSRLLGLVNEPGDLFRTAASAIDYQFGFKVSQTWFYKLLEKAIVPLFLFGVITLYLFSCIVTLGPEEEAIIEHFGNPYDSSGHIRRIGPGLTFKWPWPIDIAYKYPTRKISEISIGYVPKSDTSKEAVEPLLWGKKHYEKEYQLLVAGRSEQLGPETVPVSLVIAAVPVQYRVKELYDFLYNYGVETLPNGGRLYHAVERLKAICYHELTKLAASATIEVGDAGAAATESLLGAGRTKAKQILTNNIQAAVDKAGLGIEVVFVGLQGIHPPPELAADYQKVIGAVQKKQASILNAEADRNKTLSRLAGSVQDANSLYSLAAEYQAAKTEAVPSKIEEAAKRLDRAFAEAKGEIFQQLRTAQSYQYQKATLAHATGVRFAGQLKAYQAAPQIYMREQRLAAMEQALENIRKFVIVADKNDTQVTILELREKLTPSLYDIAGYQGSSEK